MNKYSQLVKALTIVAFLLSGCGRKKGTYYPITSSMLREAVTINEGSYFVYRDSISGVEDSFWVSHYEYYSFVSTQNNNTAESILYRMISKSGQAIGVGIGGGNDVTAKRVAGSYSNNSGEFPGIYGIDYLKDPFKVGDKYVSTFSTNINLDFKDSMIVNNVVYDSVYITKTEAIDIVDGDSVLIDFTSNYSPRNGLVKYEVKNNNAHHVWELQRSQIIK